MRRVRLFVSGLVQGISFRSFVKRNAILLDLKGFVKNLPDGRVECVFEGEDDKINQIISICNKGSDGSDIKSIDIKEEEFTAEFKDFIIVY
ncbi:acylphosphatase [Candidatus Woesearchaeota archaeon]|nr:acylphosphatase [Candidatus Woesearchaeota archaeon]